jgi:hypothetical protein
MSSDIWYHELLAKNIIMSKSNAFHPHYNISSQEFGNDNCKVDNTIITKPMCVLEFNKPLITSYKCLVSNLKGFTLEELCSKIRVSWEQIKKTCSDWIDNTIGHTDVISDIFVYDEDVNFTRVMINFNIPLKESKLFTQSVITKLQFVVPKSSTEIFNNGDVSQEHSDPRVKQADIQPKIRTEQPEIDAEIQPKIDAKTKTEIQPKIDAKTKKEIQPKIEEEIIEEEIQPEVEEATQPEIQPEIQPENQKKKVKSSKRRSEAVINNSKPQKKTKAKPVAPATKLSISDLISKYK